MGAGLTKRAVAITVGGVAKKGAAYGEPTVEMRAALADEEGVNDTGPLTSPGPLDVQCWELMGGPNGVLNLPRATTLEGNYTIAFWVNLPSDAKRGALLSGGNDRALAISADREPGVVLGDRSIECFVKGSRLPAD